MTDPFVLLGVPEETDDATVKRCYLKKVRRFPPEQHPKRFQEIRAAFETIQSERDRLAYRLFHLPPPEAVGHTLLATLSSDTPLRPDETRVLAWLATTLTPYRLPDQGDGV